MGGTDITADCCIGPKSTKFYELRAKAAAARCHRLGNAWFIRKRTEVTHIIWISPFREAFRVSLTLQDAPRRHGCIPSVELSHSGQFSGTYRG